MKGNISWRLRFHPRLEQLVRRWERMEWNGHRGVMLDMVGHVPGNETHQLAGKCGSGVAEHVGCKRAKCVFGQQVEPQQRLTQK